MREVMQSERVSGQRGMRSSRSKAVLWLGAGAVVLTAIAGRAYWQAHTLPEVTLATSPTGLSSLKADKTEYLFGGDFRVEEALLKRSSGETYFGSTAGVSSWDASKKHLSVTYPWGLVNVTYMVSGNRLTIAMATENRTSDVLQGLHYTPLVLKFPERVSEYDGSIPLLEHNIGQIAQTEVSFGSGTLAVVSEDLRRPLMIGFPWALDKPQNTIFPLSIHTNRVKSYPDSYPLVDRPINPGEKDEFVISLRFGRSKTSLTQLTGDINKKFAAAFPSVLNWSDRRPIGAIFLATGPQQWPNNPRGWFGDEHLNINTPQGQTEFRQRLLAMADNSINIMRDMNAQGAITWDVEGQQFRHATTYIGDPRMVDILAPEMSSVVDEYFARFKSAGLRVGICIRPTLLKLSEDKKNADQTPAPDAILLMMEKIAYARKRWGATLIYLDSNVNAHDPNPMSADIVEKIARRFPDCLLIPEHSNLRYYAYSAPFGELRHGVISTPEQARAIYPKAFSAIYTADGPLDLYKDGLKTAVSQGDTLLYRTWFSDPQNIKVKALYH